MAHFLSFYGFDLKALVDDLFLEQMDVLVLFEVKAQASHRIQFGFAHIPVSILDTRKVRWQH